MTQTLDMTCIRYLNLFEKITGVRTKNCFNYNNFLVFAVPANQVSRAIGENGNNIKRIVSMLGKRVKVVPSPNDSNDFGKFIAEVVSPIQFKEVKIAGDEFIIVASRDSKAALIGRNKVRLLELEKITKEFLNKNLRIV